MAGLVAGCSRQPGFGWIDVQWLGGQRADRAEKALFRHLRDMPAGRQPGICQHDVCPAGSEPAGDVGGGVAGDCDGTERVGDLGYGEGEHIVGDLQEDLAAPAADGAPQDAAAELRQ